MSFLFAHKLQTFFDNSGLPLVSGKLKFYDAGTANLAESYNDSDLGTLNANPVILNSAGRPPANIYLAAGAYRVELYNSSDVKLAESEDVIGQLPAITGVGDNGKFIAVVAGDYGLVAGADASASYVTINTEASLPNSKRLIDGEIDVVVSGSNVRLDYADDGSGGGMVADVLVKNIKEATQTNAAATGALTINYSLGAVYDMTQTGDITSFAVSNVPTGGACVLTIIRRKSNTSPYSITWGSAVKWDGGVAPTLGTVTTKVEVITLMTVNGGTTWYGGYMTAVA